MHSVFGTYRGKTPASLEWIPSGEAILELRSDGLFALKWRQVDHPDLQRIDYTGRWKEIDKTHIWLDFDEVNLMIQLGTRALSYEDREIVLIGKKRIKIDNIVLKRVK